MRSRRRARRLALDVLYEAEIRDLLPVEAWEGHGDSGWVRTAQTAQEEAQEGQELTADVLDYARDLVEGVQRHQADIDSMIASYADRWAIDRMPVVDRSLLRISIFELLWGADVPVAVVINEAVELAKTLSTDDSGRFINGLLGHIAEDRRSTSS